VNLDLRTIVKMAEATKKEEGLKDREYKKKMTKKEKRGEW